MALDSNVIDLFASAIDSDGAVDRLEAIEPPPPLGQLTPQLEAVAFACD